jgi:hypothetical protein
LLKRTVNQRSGFEATAQNHPSEEARITYQLGKARTIRVRTDLGSALRKNERGAAAEEASRRVAVGVPGKRAKECALKDSPPGGGGR